MTDRLLASSVASQIFADKLVKAAIELVILLITGGLLLQLSVDDPTNGHSVTAGYMAIAIFGLFTSRTMEQAWTIIRPSLSRFLKVSRWLEAICFIAIGVAIAQGSTYGAFFAGTLNFAIWVSTWLKQSHGE